METACSSSGTNGKRRRRNKKGCYKPRSDQGGKCSKPPSEPKEDNLKVTKEVLKSETALLALYDKWFLKVKPAQSEEDKKKRFQYFKDSCELVVKLNQEYPGGMFGLTSMANYSPQEGFGLDPNNNLKVTKEVLKSEIALLDLYDKWFLKVKPAQSEEAKKIRFQYFKQSCERVVKLNQEHPGGMFGLTSMANYSPHECFGLDPDSSDDEEDYFLSPLK